MRSKELKFIFIAFLFTSSCFLSWQLYFKVYTQKDKVNIHLFPKKIGTWTAKEIAISEDDYAILETRNAFTRRYNNDQGQEAYIFIVYSESNRKVSHPPEICYTGGGVTVVNNEHDVLYAKDKIIEVKTNKLLLERGSVQQIAHYWFKVGDEYTSNYWKQQFLIVLKTLLGQPSNSALVRISATVKANEDSYDKADRDLKDFAHAILPLLPEYLL